MTAHTGLDRPRFRALGRSHLDRIDYLDRLSPEQALALSAVSAVLPFRVNSYILEELIDWEEIPDDPIFQLTFPQAGMLESRDLERMQDLIRAGAPADRLRTVARSIQDRMNPHPAGQRELNLPTIDGEVLEGSQHKYRETVLFFPSQGQTCHAYCTYCFRWAQFVGVRELRFASSEIEMLVRYLENHTEVSDVLFTGGDPLIMSTTALARYLEPLLAPQLEHLTSIRLGTKSLAYWPYRFLTDPDADELLRLFERVRASGRQVALMAHFSHPRELQTAAVRRALRRVMDAGVVVRCQAPVVRHVNDRAEVWAEMWSEQVRLGAVPYYMFVERDTGPKRYFEVPLSRALRIFRDATSQVSGLARTVRGPSMSAAPGKVAVIGRATVRDEAVFVLKMLQGRDPDWANRVFFARFDAEATWLDQLRPALGNQEFFFEQPMRAMRAGVWQPEWMGEADVQEAVGESA